MLLTGWIRVGFDHDGLLDQTTDDSTRGPRCYPRTPHTCPSVRPPPKPSAARARRGFAPDAPRKVSLAPGTDKGPTLMKSAT